MANNPYEISFTGNPFSYTINGYDLGTSQKYSWVEGLANCPKCAAEVTSSRFYCKECGYGKDKKTKPVKVTGYEYVINDEYEHGKYFRVADKSLFETVIIEPYKKQMIVEALSLVENSDLIFNQWGFKDTIEKGTGVSLLFHGLPGTGKTLMAQAVADYLGKKLITITAAEVMDKYVGETEKKIAELFDKHKEDVILFDECDSLLGSRERARASWEVSQVNVLLNKLENHRGVTVFTTNHSTNLDKALDRRIAVKVRFEMPSQELRKQIWRRMFPKKAPLAADIDWDLLASYEITGGYVKNTVLRAARIAAFRKETEITFTVLKEALKQELMALMEYENVEQAATAAQETPEKEQLKLHQNR
ncbi:cell division cycle protein 48 homolog AF_1297 [Arthrobacter sp. Hiyo8]|uniref:ATP-binding protein n=1 Tax=Arthrobacter sp. Hiyo1 TaxID=1588020 RepID=UPI0006838F27|nr:ATP-binding protein [Arthrobacter sp. Hiyo1]BAS17588.1 cell division cycle protein 48 homolog AF_1297 [Arthrobacter sp. Hiyo8]GAP57948.1 cell division cycle protein 48 homolog AF_1297 [Arthrobacter sp. Hiyo1]